MTPSIYSIYYDSRVPPPHPTTPLTEMWPLHPPTPAPHPYPPHLTNPETCNLVRTADSADDLSFIRVIPSQILISGCPLLEFLPVITL